MDELRCSREPLLVRQVLEVGSLPAAILLFACLCSLVCLLVLASLLMRGHLPSW